MLHHSGIVQAAVVAMPDPRLGERASAFLVASERELTLPEVQAHLDGLGVAMFKWLSAWNGSATCRAQVNKVDKKLLRQRAADLTAG